MSDKYDREEHALADALLTLGVTTRMLGPESASDVIGFMRNKHGVILKREEWMCDAAAPSRPPDPTGAGAEGEEG